MYIDNNDIIMKMYRSTSTLADPNHNPFVVISAW